MDCKYEEMMYNKNEHLALQIHILMSALMIACDKWNIWHIREVLLQRTGQIF